MFYICVIYVQKVAVEGFRKEKVYSRCVLKCTPVAGPKTWNALPEDVTTISQSEYTFRCQLKT